MLLLAALMALAEPPPAPEPFLPGTVSTPATEVRPAFSPDGRCVLWGSIAGGDEGWQILQSCRDGDGWTAAQAVSFNSPANDFDPAVSPDGQTVYFFSNRPGGLGGDDLYAVERDPVTGGYGTPRNLGPRFNTAKDEWAPFPMEGGRLMFSSDGWPGLGGQDLFDNALEGDSQPRNLGAPINGPRDDFDAIRLADGSLVLTSGDLKSETGVMLYSAVPLANGIYAKPSPLPPPFNCSAEMNNGPAFNPRAPDRLYYSAYCPKIGPGHMDIFDAPWPPGN